MEVPTANEMRPAPFPRKRATVASLRRVRLSEALGRVAAISLAIAILIFAGLTLQMYLGGDPALGPKVRAQSASSAGVSSQVVTTASTGEDDTSAISAALAAQSQVAPVVPTQPAPAPAANVAPTPSPPPSPVQTSTS